MMCALAAALLVVSMPALPDPPADQKPAVPTTPTTAPEPKAAEPAAHKPVSDERFLEIARTYTSWQRVSDFANFAPTDCESRPATVQSSQSQSAETHGKKLYFLYAARPDEYIALNTSVTPAHAPIGQTIVKETYAPVEVKLSEVPRITSDGDSGTRKPLEYAIDGDRAYKIGEKRELFIMTKLDPDAFNTDRGWVYATITADGSKVIQSGMIASCMKCHDEQRHDRQFGLSLAQDLTKRVIEKNKPAPKPTLSPAK